MEFVNDKSHRKHYNNSSCGQVDRQEFNTLPGFYHCQYCKVPNIAITIKNKHKAGCTSRPEDNNANDESYEVEQGDDELDYFEDSVQQP